MVLDWIKDNLDYELNVFDEDNMWNETIVSATKEFITN